MATSENELTHEVREAARAATRANAQADFEARAFERRERPATLLGTVGGGQALAFDESAQVFLLGGRLCSLDEVRACDARAEVRWRFLEHRDWMRRLNAKACAAALERELERLGRVGGASGLDEQIRQHVRKNDSYLHGRIVDTDEEEAVAEVMAASVAEKNEQG